LGRVEITIEEDDIRAGARQRARDLAAQYAGAAGHHEGPAGEVIKLSELLKVHRSSLRVLTGDRSIQFLAMGSKLC